MSGSELLRDIDADGFSPCDLADKYTIDSCCRGNPNKPGCSPKSKFTQTFTRHVMDPNFATIGPKLQKTMFYKPLQWFGAAFLLSEIILYLNYFNSYTRIIFAILTFAPLAKYTSMQGHRVAHPSGLPNPYFKGD